MSGTWTLYNWLFKPPAGPNYDAQFGEGFDKVDLQLQLLSQSQTFYKLRVTNSIESGVSASPSISPSISPSASPSESPSRSTSYSPSSSPSISPSKSFSASPSISPSKSPSISPSKSPSASPSVSPSIEYSTTSMRITAELVTVLDSDDNPMVLTNFNKVIDFTTNGLNGLDTGTITINNWYHLFCIARSDGTQAGLASLSATDPVLPTGYTYKKLVSTVRCIGTGIPATTPTLPFMYQIDRTAYVTPEYQLFSVNAATYVSQDISGVVPANALFIYCQPVNLSDYDIAFELAWDSGGLHQYMGFHLKSTGINGSGYYVAGSSMKYMLNPDNPQILYARGMDGNLRGGMVLQGYELDI